MKKIDLLVMLTILMMVIDDEEVKPGGHVDTGAVVAGELLF